jgi:hypothetical protein
MAYDPENQQIDRGLQRNEAALMDSLPPSPQFGNGTKDLPDWYIDLNADLITFQHQIMGEVFDPTNKKNPWKKIGTPIMNEYGTHMFMAYLRMCAMNKNLIMCDIPNLKIANRICRDVCVGTCSYLLTHMKTFELKLKDIDYLNNVVRQLVRASVLRAWRGGERGRVKETYTRTEAMQPQYQKKKGWLDTVFGSSEDSGD